MPTGGIISLNDKNHKIYEKKLLSRRWCGITNRHDFVYDVKEMGWNYYMNEFSAAIGISQLKKLNKTNSIRKKIAKRYDNEIEILSKIPFSNDCSYHLYWIQVNNRNSFMKQMKNSGIETGIHYKPIHKMSYYGGKTIKNLATTEKISNEIVSIPIHPNLKENEMDFIIRSINKIS